MIQYECMFCGYRIKSGEDVIKLPLHLKEHPDRVNRMLLPHEALKLFRVMES